MVSVVVPGESDRMVPQPSSFTGTQQQGKFAAGRVVSIAGWCLLSPGAQQWSGHGSGLQIIGCSLLNWNLRGSCLFHNAGGRAVLKTACFLRRSRAPGKKREACYCDDHSNPDGCFRMFRIHAIYGVTWFVGIIEASWSEDCRSISDVGKFRYKVYRGLAAPSTRP